MRLWWKPKGPSPQDGCELVRDTISQVESELESGMPEFDGIHVYNILRVPAGTDKYLVEPPPLIEETALDYTCWTASRHARGWATWQQAWIADVTAYYGETDFDPPTILWLTASWRIWGLGKNGYYITRIKLYFATDDFQENALNATLRLYLNSNALEKTGACGGAYVVGGSGLAATNTYYDYATLRTYTTEYAHKDKDELIANQFYDFELNQDGVNYINTQISAGEPVILGVRQYLDLNNIPVVNNSLEASYEFAGPNASPTIRRPRLILEYA